MGFLGRQLLKNISRRRLLTRSGGAALLPFLSACDGPFDQTLTVAAHTWVGYELMFVARDKGWLDVNQVRLFETVSATDSLKALREGKVQAAALTLDEMLAARAAGLPLSLVLIFNMSVGADMLVVRPGIKTLADLQGRRIGFEPSSVGELMLAEVLRMAGFTKDNVKLIHRSIDRQLDAWKSNEVDALVTYEPVASQLLAQGGVNLYDSRQLPNTIIDVLAVHADALGYRHASAISHLLQSHFRALNLLQRNPQDAAYRMARHLNLPAASVLQAFKGLTLPDAVINYRLLAGSSPELLTSARKLSNTMVKSHMLKQDDPLIDLIRADFLPTDDLPT